MQTALDSPWATSRLGVQNRADNQEAQEILQLENILLYLVYGGDCISDFLYKNSKTLFHIYSNTKLSLNKHFSSQD